MDKTKFLDAYFDVLLEEGLKRTSVNRISEYLGIPPEDIQNYFNTDEELYLSLLKYFFNHFENDFFLQYENEKNIAKRLDIIINKILFPKKYSANTYNSLAAFKYLATKKTNFASEYERLFYRFRNYLTDEFRTMMKNGLIAWTDPVALTDTLLSLSSGYKEIQAITHDRIQFEMFYNLFSKSAISIINRNYI